MGCACDAAEVIDTGLKVKESDDDSNKGPNGIWMVVQGLVNASSEDSSIHWMMMFVAS